MNRGFTMIEVLVALFVLALGLLGLAMLQTTSLRLNTNSYSRTQATFLAYDILDRIRANPVGFEDGAYTVEDMTDVNAIQTTFATCKQASNTTCNCEKSSATCSSSQLSQFDLGRWYERQYDPSNPTVTLLPGAAEAFADNKPATILRDGNRAIVTLYWKEQDETGFHLKSQSWVGEIEDRTP